jgi:hypothetical protein
MDRRPVLSPDRDALRRSFAESSYPHSALPYFSIGKSEKPVPYRLSAQAHCFLGTVARDRHTADQKYVAACKRGHIVLLSEVPKYALISKILSNVNRGGQGSFNQHGAASPSPIFFFEPPA